MLRQIDLLLDTANPNPKEEKAWLQLILASIENKWKMDNAIVRLYEVCFSIEDEQDTNIKCYVLARILTSLKNIADVYRSL